MLLFICGLSIHFWAANFVKHSLAILCNYRFIIGNILLTWRHFKNVWNIYQCFEFGNEWSCYHLKLLIEPTYIMYELWLLNSEFFHPKQHLIESFSVLKTEFNNRTLIRCLIEIYWNYLWRFTTNNLHKVSEHRLFPITSIVNYSLTLW